MASIDLLISDCDGVIVDSEIISHRVLFEALSLHVPAEQLQSTPYKVLLLAEHDPVNGVTVHGLGLEVQVVGLMYLSAPPLQLLSSYP